jgi:hypothetical protein
MIDVFGSDEYPRQKPKKDKMNVGNQDLPQNNKPYIFASHTKNIYCVRLTSLFPIFWVGVGSLGDPPINKSASTSSPTAKVIWYHSRICFARCHEVP